MATITITIPNPVLNRVLDAIAARNGFDTSSGMTKAEFAKAWIIGLVKKSVKEHEGYLASEAAMAASNNSIDSGIIIT